ncbi:MAG: efflux RND transporter periplasmic adaptor subunit [Ectothiorhodospiraceae bacterium]|nr:efflux RND transporter periplasmic adaptor subunit [Ectothiorhodospiraceae bacterium]
MNDQSRAPTTAPSTADVRGLLADAGPPSGRRRWGRALLWLVVLAAAVMAGWWWLTAGTGAASVRYVTQPVTRGGLKVLVTATGSVQPTNQVEVSSELSGTVREVRVDFNSPVEAGDLLAVLDTDKLEATVASARAKLAAARARVQEAAATVRETQRDRARVEDLARQRAVATHEVDAAIAANERALASLESARADVLVAEAQLRLDETNLVKARIHSPIGGVVLSRAVDPGQTVAASFQAPVLFTIAEDLRQMELQVDVDEADVGRLAEGQPATFAVDAYPERRFPARIRDIRYAPETIQGVVTYKAVLAIDNGELLLRPGMTATAEITVQEVTDALLVPNAALRFEPPAQPVESDVSPLRRLIPGMPRFRAASRPEPTGSERRVWVVRDGEPQPVAVTVGATDGRLTEVVDGVLTEGTEVVVDARTGNGGR